MMTTSSTIVRQPGRDRGDRLRDRGNRLDVLDADRMAECLAFLAGFRPEVFDAVLNATEPCDDRGPDDEPGVEPFCVTCGNRAGIFPSQSRDWLHYRADTVGNAEPYEAGHEPVIGWRAEVHDR
jgi:hypothetical protein